MTLLRLVNLLQVKEPFLVFAKALQAIPAAAHGAHEVQAEAIDVRLGASREFRELGMAADAGPHASEHTPGQRQGCRLGMSPALHDYRGNRHDQSNDAYSDGDPRTDAIPLRPAHLLLVEPSSRLMDLVVVPATLRSTFQQCFHTRFADVAEVHPNHVATVIPCHA